MPVLINRNELFLKNCKNQKNMKTGKIDKFLKIVLFLIFIIPLMKTNAQNVYTVSGGEFIFQLSEVEQNDESMSTNLRFTLWFHAGEYVHLDFDNNIGFFSGLALRNVGFITSQNDVRVKYRSYNLGIPLAIKLGSFKDNFYLYGGGEYEWMFHFKQKTFINDQKVKYSEWFSDRTPNFIPSVFAGIQFPKGINIKFKYYLDNYLNHKFQSTDDNPYNDYTSFNKTQVWYISLSFFFKNAALKDFDSSDWMSASR